MQTREFNFDGLVGPSHNYAGLSFGNVASMSHKAAISNPREAALQGLKKMNALSELGFAQGVLAPQERPDVRVLRRLGFGGDEAHVLKRARAEAPELLAAAASASSMWTANAATVSPSRDAADGRVHFTAANLSNKFHRSIEFETTSRILRAMFPEPERFVHHDALPMGGAFGDEGAANHTRFAKDYGEPGVQLFVYGRVALGAERPEPVKFPARQTLEASQAIARLHELDPRRVVYAQQNPEAIDAGAFHNDVVAVGNLDTLFYHERAFSDAKRVVDELASAFTHVSGAPFRALEVLDKDVALADAIKSYLFNSQLVARADGTHALISPLECRENPRVRAYLEAHVGAGRPIGEVHYFDLRQSMHNGGGPACLRLRVVLSEAERAAANPRVLFTSELYGALTDWVKRHYRDRLTLDDLADPKFLVEGRLALDELTQLLNLGSVYVFQR